MLLVSLHDVWDVVHVAGQQSLVPVALGLGVDAHDELGRFQLRVTHDGVEDVVHAGVHGPEHSDVALDKLGVQVHVLLAPALNAEVEAANGHHVSTVHGGDAEAELAPVTSGGVEVLGVDDAALALAALAVLGLLLAHGGRVVLAEHDGEVDLLAQLGVEADPDQGLLGPHDVHVHQEQQAIGTTALRPQLQAAAPRESTVGLHELYAVVAVSTLVALEQVDGTLVVAVVPVAVVEHHDQPGRLVPPQAHVLKVLHEAHEDLEASRQGHDEVDRLLAFVLLLADPVLPPGHLLEEVQHVVPHGGGGQEHRALLPHLRPKEALLQVGVAPDLHRHLATFVLAVDEEKVQDEVGSHQGVDTTVAVQDLLEVDGAATLASVAIDQLHHLGQREGGRRRGDEWCVCDQFTW